MVERVQLAEDVTVLVGDVREGLAALPDKSVHTVITSPPFWGLRSYLSADDPDKSRELGAETLHDCLGWATGAACGSCFVCHMVEVFREVRRVLRRDGTCWLNLGDSYNGSGGAGGDYGPGGSKEGQPKFPGRRVGGLKQKDLCGIPERVVMALQADGWYWRAKIPWVKASAMPESVVDRPSVAHESIFLLSKSAKYYYDVDAARVAATIQSEKALSWARDGKHSNLLVPGQSVPQHRPEREQVESNNPAGRNRRTSDWWNESLDLAIAHLQHVQEHGGMAFDDMGEPLGLMVNPEPTVWAHFACFPSALVEPMVKLSTSPRACPACGAPWARVVERTAINHRSSNYQLTASAPMSGGIGRNFPDVTRTTIGWRPTCSCPPETNDGSGRCVVLDPFMGSGTTAQVAVALGREAIGCELSRDYVAIMRRRLSSARAQRTLALE